MLTLLILTVGYKKEQFAIFLLHYIERYIKISYSTINNNVSNVRDTF